MANQTVNFTINLDGNAYTGIAQIDAALGNVLVNAKNTKSFFERFKTSAFNFDVITNAIGKVSQAFQSLVGSSLDFEQQQANMRTLLNGDAEATDNLIGKIREYGKATVYDRSGLIEAQKTMMAFGLDAEYAFGKLKNIGDIALGDKQKMQSLALAFSQMSSTGKLMGQDLLQMINAGFNPLEVISQKTGKSMAELKEEMGKGAISAEQVAQAFEWATEEGGRFYQGAETAAQTTAGKIAKMKDQIDDFKISLFELSHGATAWAAELGNMFVPLSQSIPLFKGLYNISAATFNHLKALNFAGILGGIGRKATEARISLAFMRKDIETCSMASLGFIRNTVRATMAVGRFATVGLFNAVKGMGAYLLSLITGGAASRTFANVATASFAKFALSAKAACRAVGVAIVNIPIVGWIAAAVAAVIGLVTLLWNKSEGFRRLVFGTWEAVKAAVGNAWQYVKTAAQVTWEALKRLFARLKEAFAGLWERLKDLFARLKEDFAEAWNRIKPVLANIADKVWAAVKVVMKVVAVVSMVAGAVIAVVGMLVKTVWDYLLKPLFQHLFSIVSKVVSWVGTAVGGIIGFVTSIPGKISAALDNVRTFFANLWSSVTGMVRDDVDRITGFVTSIPGRISVALDNVRTFFADLWDSVTDTVRNAVDRIVNTLGNIWQYVKISVQTTWAVLKRPFIRLKSLFAETWDGITGTVRNAIDRITGSVTSIPGRISAALGKVRTFFANLWDSVTGTVRDDVDRIIGFVTSIPGRISAALGKVRTFFANLWDDVTGIVRSAIDRITGMVQGLRDRVSEIFGKIGDFVSGVWERVRESVGGAVDWISGKLEQVGGWIKTRIADPIKKAFTGMWDVIRDVFDKILTKLGKLFAPIRELWNKLFPKDKMKDVKLAYGEGAEKGTRSWRESKGDVDTGKDTVVLDGKNGTDGTDGKDGKSGKDGKTKKKLSDGTLGKNAGTVAGRAQQITIKLDNMVGTMNFNGGLNENASNVESTLTEMLARILGMAQTAA